MLFMDVDGCGAGEDLTGGDEESQQDFEPNVDREAEW
jgi:hypothetical protein